jgi:IS605 OrfB family transposase
MARAKTKDKPSAKEKRKGTHLTSNVRVEIVGPLGVKMSEIYPHMHAIRSMTHRCLNSALSRVAIEDALCSEGHDGKTWGPAAYAGIEKRLEDEREYAEKRRKKSAAALLAINKEISSLEKALAKRKSKGKQDKLAELQKKQRSEELNVSLFSAVEDVTALPSGIKDAMANKATSAFKLYKKESFLGTRSLPSFRNNSPIYVRDGREHWNIYKDKRGFILEVKLHPGRTSKVKFVLKTEHGGDISHLQRMTDVKGLESGIFKLGDLKLLYKKKKWFAQMSYSWLKPKQKEISMKRVAAVRRGLRHFMVVAFAGKNPFVGPWMSGGDITAVRQQFDARVHEEAYKFKQHPEPSIFEAKRKFAERADSLRKHRRELGDAARGHGVTRREQRVTRLRDKEANWVKTKCQQAAAWLADACEKRGIGLILLEDWNKDIEDHYLAQCNNEHLRRILQQFPFYLLKESVVWAAKKKGIAVRVIPVQYAYDTCPKCGHQDEDQYDRKGRVFECIKCKTKRPIEQALAWHMLNSAGVEGAAASMAAAEKSKQQTVSETAQRTGTIKKTNGKPKRRNTCREERLSL